MTIRRAGSTLISASQIGGARLGVITIPPEARQGDLLVLSLLSGAGAAPPTCSDPRLRHVDATDAGVPSGQQAVRDEQRGFGVWAGTMTDDRQPIEIDLIATAGQWAQFAAGLLEVYRDDSGAGVEMEWDRRNWGYGGMPDDPEPPDMADGGYIAGAVGEGYSALLILGVWRNDVAGTNGRLNFTIPRFKAEWDVGIRDQVGSNPYLDIYTFLSTHTTTASVDYQGTNPFDFVMNGVDFKEVVLGVRPTAPPVVRQYPRDDGLGLSSAPRLYPNRRGPQGGRIVGRHQ